ncbi:type IV pilin protein [Marinobacter sp. UBA3607]|uniref:type IV pilin protein n=1 Tax=Marinobacter sp. UBA3607 TaxID=1946820 RepID=UPI002580C1D0|nr:type IV pilin protein [Marinobacter sp. UBA3607]
MIGFGRRANQGFTLIEVMIVVAIVGILAAVAYPSYQEHVKASRRAEAQSALMGLAAAMERHFTANNTYKGAGPSGGDTGAPSIYYDQVPDGGGTAYYNLTITSASDSAFVVQATPVNAQDGDGFLDINSQGIRRWDRDDDNSIDTGETSWKK